LAWTTPSFADTCTADPHTCAVSLFEEGRRRLESGDWAAAIPIFQQSLEQQATVGALLNLGDCYAKGGRSWQAYVQYRLAVRLAKETSDARSAAAEKSAGAVEALVLRVKLVGGELGAVVRIDGKTVESAQVTLLVAGEYALAPSTVHSIEVTSPVGTHWSGSVEGPPGADREIVVHDVPTTAPSPASPTRETAAAPPPPPPPAATPTADSPGANLRTAGLVVAGAGGVGLVLGTVAGVIAISDTNRLHSLCQANGGSYPGACGGNHPDVVAANDAANGAALASTIALAVGALALAGGAVLYFMAPRVSLSVTPTAGGAGLWLRNTW
jgi:serine/threonine-protein kinase